MNESHVEAPPLTLFMSYSHDDAPHKLWVKNLATRLEHDGIHVILDQWDLPAGGDLPSFMHSMASADRVLTVCTPSYVTKANKGQGGVGYERMILTAQLMKDVNLEKIIPIVRMNTKEEASVPVFLGSKLYVNFREDADFEQNYQDLLMDIYGQRGRLRPVRGKNPYQNGQAPAPVQIEGEGEGERTSTAVNSSKMDGLVAGLSGYSNSSLASVVDFDFTNNNGQFLCGSGDQEFLTEWSNASNSSIHVYNDPFNISGVAIAKGAKNIDQISDPESYDFSSRSRTPKVGDVVVFKNINGKYMVAQIERIQASSHGDPVDRLVFAYSVLPSH